MHILAAYPTTHVFKSHIRVTVVGERQDGALEEIQGTTSADLSAIEAAVFGPDTGDVIEIHGERFRCVRFQTRDGEAATLVHAGRPLRPLDSFGLSSGKVKLLSDLGKRTGLVIILGMPGNGKTELQAALADHWMRLYPGRGYEWSDPPEIEMPLKVGGSYFTQTQIQANDYPHATAILKQARPRFVLYGEVRHPATAAAGIELAQAGPLVVMNFNADSIINGLSGFLALASVTDNHAYARLSTCITAVIYTELRRSFGAEPVVSLLPVVFDHRIFDDKRVLIRNGNLSGLNQSIDTAKRTWVSLS